MIRPSELVMAQLRHELRELYKNIGYAGSLQVLYEMLLGAEAFALVIMEEWKKERDSL